MQIIVPIKQVPETSNVKLDPKTGTMIRTGVETIINPLDLYAIEAALRLRESTGGEITVITMGPPAADKALREACAMGCDHGILLSDKAFGGADTWATSYTWFKAIQKNGPFDLVICGERATDGDTGQVGPGIASFLDLSLATYVNKAELGDAGLRVNRLVEGGAEQLWMSLPAVITVVKDIASPRLPTLRGMQRARKMELPVWHPQDIDADISSIGLNGSPTRVVKVFHPTLTRKGQMVSVKDPEDVEKIVTSLVQFLKERNLIQGNHR